MIGIIGGGISGLALLHYLRGRGIESVLLEADPEPGGVMRTVSLGGLPLDLGPQRLRLTAPVLDLIRSAGLEGEMLTAPARLPLWVYRAGRLRRVPFTATQALRTDLLSLRGKLRVIGEVFTGGTRPDETVESYLVRKFGREAYGVLLGPLYGGLYASDPARMMTRHGLKRTLIEFGVRDSVLLALLRRGRRAHAAVPTVGFQDGLGSLPRAMARVSGAAVRLGTPVMGMEPTTDGWVLHLGGAGMGEALRVDAVVLALPAAPAAELLSRVSPEASRRVASLRYNPLAVVHLQAGGGKLEGFGYQVAFGEPLETRGVTWNASIFGRDGVYTAYLGGMGNPSLVERGDDQIGALAAAEFETVTGVSCLPLMVSRTAIPAWDTSWDALDGLSLPAGVEVCSNWSARPGIPGRLAQAQRLADALSSKR